MLSGWASYPLGLGDYYLCGHVFISYFVNHLGVFLTVLLCTAQVSKAQNLSVAQLDPLLEAVIDDPTNIEKNFTLLEAQTRQGDLLGASASLERILILDPDSKLARVLLAEVQFNLGNLTSAKTTLTEL